MGTSLSPFFGHFTALAASISSAVVWRSSCPSLNSLARTTPFLSMTNVPG